MVDRAQLRRDIEFWRYECARDIEQLRPLKAYERFVAEIDAKRAWLARLPGCGMCHGTGVRLKAVPSPPMLIGDDGMVKVRRFFGGAELGCVYEGWEPYDPTADGPRTREVWCDHP